MKRTVIIIAKQFTCQRYIIKINSTRLRKAKWDLVLPLSEARANKELVSLGDSQMLRFIDELNGVHNVDDLARQKQAQIRRIRKEPDSLQNRRKIKKLYAELDEILFKPDYMCLIIDKESDYWRACEGFCINGIKYVRLLGTNGGVKMSTIVFVSERLAPELRRRIDNGRNLEKQFVPAKLEAYRALCCSGSIPVSLPHGIAVVDDCITHFKADVINISDELPGEPVMEFEANADVELNESDGYGIMLPSLAERWSEELNLDYIVGGVNTRFCWEKGMVFTFDFLDFADNVAGTRIIKDAWGHEVDLSNVELILTTSMLKLWDSYDSCEHYLRCCAENHYTFGITKTCPKEVESERTLNYQFIQSYDLDDNDIEELIVPNIQEFKDVLGLDPMKALLFLRGVNMNMDNAESVAYEDSFTAALMADASVLNDPFIRKKTYDMIKKRIDDAKVGVIKVHGNFTIVSGDPYSLCQSIFGMEVTGLLGPGEVFSGYWAETDAEKLACFRAPMTTHSNIRKVSVVRRLEARYWYQHMLTCTILNSWDTAAHALNGCDKHIVACVSDGAVKTR